MKNAQKKTVNGAQRDMGMKPTHRERIEAVVEWSGMSANAFARHIGLPRGENIYQIKKGNNGISIDVAEKICTCFHELDKLWLLTGDGEMFRKDAPAGPWSNMGTPNSEAFIGFVAALVLPELINKPECRDPYTMAVQHAKELMAALAKKGGEQ